MLKTSSHYGIVTEVDQSQIKKPFNKLDKAFKYRLIEPGCPVKYDGSDRAKACLKTRQMTKELDKNIDLHCNIFMFLITLLSCVFCLFSYKMV